MSRILVVDDDQQIRLMLQMWLERDGHEVHLAEDGNDALDALKLETDGFDVVITDIVMPDKEGLELILELKKKYHKLKIIAMSGGGQLHPLTYLRMAQGLKADKTFRKPLKTQDLLEAVRELAAKTD
jgi:DNA-binding NtrC family response regulator